MDQERILMQDELYICVRTVKKRKKRRRILLLMMRVHGSESRQAGPLMERKRMKKKPLLAFLVRSFVSFVLRTFSFSLILISLVIFLLPSFSLPLFFLLIPSSLSLLPHLIAQPKQDLTLITTE